MKTHSRLLLLAAFLFAITGLRAEELTKTWEKSFDVNADALLEVDNQFGKIDITNWDQNKVEVKVTITVSDKSEKNLQKLLDGISVESEASSSNVKLETKLAKSSNAELTIDYAIKAPASLNLKLENAFGDISMVNATGRTEVRLQYGSLKADRLESNENALDIAFGNGIIDHFGGGYIHISYGNLSLDDCGACEIKSSFSTLDLDEVTTLDLESEYDKVNIDEVTELTLDGAFSAFNIDRLQKSLKADIQYSGFDLDEVSGDFTSLKIDSQMGSVDLEIDDDASYNFHTMASMGEISLPSKAVVDKRIEKLQHLDLIGRMGDDPGNRSVEIEVQHGSIDID